MTTAVQDAMADLQQPGTSVELRGPNGKGARLEDPLKVCEALCEIAEKVDPNTEPWPRDGEGEEVEYVSSGVGQEIGDGLIAGIARLAHLRAHEIHYVYRNKETWESKGRTVYGQMKRVTGLLRHYAEADFIVLLNWPIWRAMTPMQRVALVYHELRHGDSDGKVRGHDFEGFFDELSLFGTQTYRDWHALAQAVGRGEDVRHQYSLDLSVLDDEPGSPGMDEPFPAREGE